MQTGEHRGKYLPTAYYICEYIYLCIFYHILTELSVLKILNILHNQEPVSTNLSLSTRMEDSILSIKISSIGLLNQMYFTLR